VTRRSQELVLAEPPMIKVVARQTETVVEVEAEALTIIEVEVEALTIK